MRRPRPVSCTSAARATALFSYLYAKRFGGQFLLRIETPTVSGPPRKPSTRSSKACLARPDWRQREPIYQTQRFDRYKEVIAQMVAAGTAYHCYASKEELDALRAEQMARKEKPRYDGRWRPEAGKTLPSPPAGVPRWCASRIRRKARLWSMT